MRLQVHLTRQKYYATDTVIMTVKEEVASSSHPTSHPTKILCH